MLKDFDLGITWQKNTPKLLGTRVDLEVAAEMQPLWAPMRGMLSGHQSTADSAP